MSTTTQPRTTTQRQEPVLARNILPADDSNRFARDILVHGGLHYITGNRAPHFMLTYAAFRKGRPKVDFAGGAGHDVILQHFPQFADLAALHLSDIDGAPMHAVDNGWYWLAGACGGLGETYHGGSGDHGKPADECLAIFAKHCRINLADAARIRSTVRRASLTAEAQRRRGYTVDADPRAAALLRLNGILDNMRPRWKAEADACIAKHGLVVFGDPWTAPHACPRCGVTVPDDRGRVPCWHRDCPE